MVSRFRERLTFANVASSIALFAALSTGGAYAADKIGPKDIDKNAVKSKHIKNAQVKGKDVAADAIDSSKVADGSLLSQDFGDGQLPQGPKGDTGATGPRGATGATGPKGDPGEAATKLFINVRPNCASFEDSSGVVGIALPFGARCDVRFNRSVVNCIAVATPTFASGELSVVEPGDVGSSTFSGLDSNEIGVTYRNSTDGSLRTSDRQAFSLAVFC